MDEGAGFSLFYLKCKLCVSKCETLCINHGHLNYSTPKLFICLIRRPLQMKALGVNNSQILIRTHLQNPSMEVSITQHLNFILKFIKLQLGRKLMDLEIVDASAYNQHCFLGGNKQTKKEFWISGYTSLHLLINFTHLGKSCNHSVPQFPTCQLKIKVTDL